MSASSRKAEAPVHRATRKGLGLVTACGVTSKSVWRSRLRVSFTRWRPVTCDRCLRTRTYTALTRALVSR